MNKKFEPKGIITALITPFKDGKIDLLALENLLKKQLEAQIDAIVLFGTTGEPLSLSESEKHLLFLTAKEIICKKMPIIAGISTPVTHLAIRYAQKYKQMGASAILQITPYYYRCNDNGIFKHFKNTSEEVGLPIIVYNVKQRTNYDLTDNNKLFLEICNLKNVCAAKIAEPNKNKLNTIIKNSKIPILCGCDENNYSALKNGAKGCISVASNLYPKSLKNIYNLLCKNDFKKAKLLDKKLKPFYRLCSIEPNPIPIKYAVAKALKIEADLRLPLDIISSKNADKINDFINNYEE